MKEDYTAKSKAGGAGSPDKPQKEVRKVTSGEVIVQKKKLGRKIKDMFIEADFKSAANYVIGDVLIPALRNLIVDASTKGIERVVYGERATSARSRVGSGPRITYNNPINRSGSRYAPAVDRGPRTSRSSSNDIILVSKDDADQVLEDMGNLLSTYEVVSVADVNQLIGIPTKHTDNKWGWFSISGAEVVPVHNGFWLDLPDPEPI